MSLYEDRFLSGLRNDPESTLWSYGFALSPQEMESIRQFFGDAQDRGLSDEDILEVIRDADQVERRIWPW